MAVSLFPSELATYMGVPVDSIDGDRANLMLSLAEDLCVSIVSPLPDTARTVVLAVAARAMVDTTGIRAVGLGSGQITFQGGSGGIYLSRGDIATLRRLAGAGGAFTVDPTPAGAGTGLPPWDQNVTWLEGMPLVEERTQ